MNEIVGSNAQGDVNRLMKFSPQAQQLVSIIANYFEKLLVMEAVKVAKENNRSIVRPADIKISFSMVQKLLTDKLSETLQATELDLSHLDVTLSKLFEE